jgi:hypothetical protein
MANKLLRKSSNNKSEKRLRENSKISEIQATKKNFMLE